MEPGCAIAAGRVGARSARGVHFPDTIDPAPALPSNGKHRGIASDPRRPIALTDCAAETESLTYHAPGDGSLVGR
ncbi:hypothetical protein OJF2_59070 [Aquisphaera giovannonii]|uniref:Uncharacterized protein n=1 Tax=Aquisphaera giovannonii TaxID=406548 RepID=A0A5B9WA50_9BACT|nr:hypothetical protein OJF2_59070 [Aquisphaera giovannonii]